MREGAFPAPSARTALRAVLLGYVWVVALSGSRANAQVATTAVLVGTVRDQTGAVITNCRVSLTNVDTGISRSDTSSADGNYSLTHLSAGRYTLEAEAPGFKRNKIGGIELRVAQNARYDITLEIGQISEVVQVQGAVPLGDTETPVVGAVVGEEAILQLPLNGRNFVQLASLTAGITSSENNRTPNTDLNPIKSPSPTGGGIAAFGTSYTLDGASNRDMWSQSYNVLPPIDSIKEFKVQVGQYSAAYGFGGGSVINTITKSGTNQFHGTAWEFLRNQVFDAANFFSVRNAVTGEKTKAPLKRNQFGFTFGGPISKNRTFFFATYEGTRERRGLTYVTKVPTAAERSGDLTSYATLTNKSILDPVTGAAFPNNVIPGSRIDPISKGILAAIVPLPNNLSDPLRNYISAPSARRDYNNYSIRVDHQLTSKHQLFARYSMTRPDFFAPGNNSSGFTAVGGQVFKDRWQNASVGATTVLGPRLINDLRIGYDRGFNVIRGQNVGDLVTRLGLQPPLGRGDPNLGGVPGISWGRSSMIASFLNIYRLDDTYWTYSLRDDLTWIHGKHTVQFGGEYQRNMGWGVSDTVPSSVSFSGFLTGDGFSDFLLGLPATISASQPPRERPDMRSFFLGGYAQDQWNVSKRVTLNWGIRYEVPSPPTELHGNMARWDPTLGNGVGGLLFPHQNTLVKDFYTNKRTDLPYGFLDSDSIWAWDKNNWGPRLGLAYRPFGGTRTVIRSGYGIYYWVETQFSRGRNSLPPNVLSGSLTSDPNIPTLAWNSAATQRILDSSVLGRPFGLQEAAPPGGENLNPYIQQWSLSVAQEILKDTVVEAQYMGSKTTHIVLFIDEQYATDGPGPGNLANRVPFKSWGAITLRHNAGSANYNGLLLTLERRFKGGLAFKSSYTWSKALSRGGAWARIGFASLVQNRNNLKGEVARIGEDVRQRFTSYMVWDLPFGHGRRIAGGARGPLDHVIGGWQFAPIVTARTGFPMFVSIPAANCNAALSFFCYANRTGTPADYDVGGKGVDRPRYLRANFPVPVFTYGNAGPHPIDENGAWTFDMTLSKRFRLTERVGMEFRFEGFNIFNHPVFPVLNETATSASFGLATRADEPRDLQFALKFTF